MPQMSNAVLSQRYGDALVIVFNRPEARSPLSVGVVEHVQRTLDSAASDKDVKRVVFTGRENVFASGADLREIAALSAYEARAFGIRGQRLMNTIAGMPQTTISAVNGYCFGGALDLALACDHRIASPQAVFSHPGASLGILTGWGGTQRLPRLVGQAVSFEMFFTAGRVDALTALRIGLIQMISDDPLSTALRA